MSAGSGVAHGEFNPSDSELVHLYQIWLTPQRKSIEPSYEQKAFDAAERTDRLRLVASPGGKQGSLTIHQDADIHLATLSSGKEVVHKLTALRHARLQVLRGSLVLNGQRLTESDGAAVSEVGQLDIVAGEQAEVMLFDLA